MRSTRLAIFVLSVLAASLLFLPALEHGEGAIFINDNFDDNVILIYIPEVPAEYEEVNVTIIARNEVFLVEAYLSIEIRDSDSTKTSTYTMTRVNDTSMFATLNGYAPTTEVSFHVKVFDGARQLTSRTYQYEVAAKFSWKHPNFEQNLDLTFGPTPPREDERVNVSIGSVDPTVKISRADINMEVVLPGFQEPLAGGESMNRVDELHFHAVLPTYTGGSVVTFSVTAYDEFWTPMVSRDFNYTVIVPEEEFLYHIFVAVFDNVTGQYMNGNVTVYNDAGYNVSRETMHGISWTLTDMPEGKYTIKVVPAGGDGTNTKIRTIYVDRYTTDFTFVIYYGPEDISTNFDVMEFPTTTVIVTFIIISLLVPVVFFFMKKQDEAEVKKKKEKKQGKKRKTWAFRILGSISENMEQKKDLSTAAAFGVLGFFGAMWAPFYPWWMILLITLVTGALGYRFPYLSLLFISFVAIGSTAFQTAQFGLMFMVFSLFICICSLFNWKFGYLSFLTVFLSTFGVSFLVPVFALFLFSLFISISTTVVSGLFLAVVTSTGNLNNLSFIVSSFAVKKESIATFSRLPPNHTFSPNSYFEAVVQIRHIDLPTMGSFIQSYMTTMIPVVQVMMWVLMVLVIYFIRRELGTGKRRRSIFLYSSIAFGILILSTIGGMLLAGFERDVILSGKYILIYLLSFPALLFVVSLSYVLRKAYSEFYVDRKSAWIGTRIGDMMSFRRSSFEKVGGLEDVKGEIRDTMIGPLLRPGLSKRYGVEPPKGMMLFGPPGCGKTLLMRVIASELKVEMIGVKCSDIMSKWYGESENLINDLFKIAREKHPCVLFLDEIDAIAKRRDFYSADDVTPRLLSIMLSEMDGMDEFSGIIIIAATNKPELVDPALLRPGRFDKLIYIPPPGLVDRLEILKIHVKGKPTSKRVDIRKLAKLTRGYSGADIANLTKECATNAMKRAILIKRNTVITMKDFLDMIRILKPSITKDMLDDYAQLRQHYERKSKKTGELKRKKKYRRQPPKPRRRAPIRSKFDGYGPRKRGEGIGRKVSWGDDDREEMDEYYEGERDEWRRGKDRIGSGSAEWEEDAPEYGYNERGRYKNRNY